MNRTKIEWVKNPDGSQGYTWNPITGCLNHTPEGLCLGGLFPCYAYKLANGRLRQRYLANENIAYDEISDEYNPFGTIKIRELKYLANPFYPRFWPERLELTGPIKPCGIFVCDMGELFGDWIPRQWQEAIFREITESSGDRFYLLTKQPQNLIKFSPFPDNCWVGGTATNAEALWLALENFKRIEAKVKYISFEPLLEDVFRDDWSLARNTLKSLVNWVIIGAQTKPYKPPKWEWVSEIIDACVDAGIPYFLKDNLEKVVPRTSNGFQLGELRQEMPKFPI